MFGAESLWAQAFSFESPLKDYLDTVDEATNPIQLTRLFSEDELIQEVKDQNDQIINFMTSPEVVGDMLLCLIGRSEEVLSK